MATNDFIKRLLELPGFRQRVRQVTIDSVARQFPSLATEKSIFDGVPDWNYLLLCASALAQSPLGEAQATALRIACHCLVAGDQTGSRKSAACVVLDTLTNQPAIDLALRRGLIGANYSDDIPLPLRIDRLQRAVRYSIVLGNQAVVHVNRFQKSLWDAAESADWLSVSAPTSAGKSFMLVNWLAEYLRERPKSLVVYVVPTRALIQQVQQHLTDHFADHGLQGTKVSCLPLAVQLNASGSTVFVLTQERLHSYTVRPKSEEDNDYVDRYLDSKIDEPRELSVQIRHLDADVIAWLGKKDEFDVKRTAGDLIASINKAIAAKSAVDPNIKPKTILLLQLPVMLGKLVRQVIQQSAFDFKGFRGVWIAPFREECFEVFGPTQEEKP